MDQSREAAERVRSIIHAMERSIDAARARRLHGNDAVEPPPAPPRAEVPPTPLRIGDAPPRLKARPKRPTHVTARNDPSPLRSHAG